MSINAISFFKLYFQSNFFQFLFGSTSNNIRTCNCSKMKSKKLLTKKKTSKSNSINILSLFLSSFLPRRMWYSQSSNSYAWRHRFASIWISLVGTNYRQRSFANWSNTFKWSLRYHSGNYIDWVMSIVNLCVHLCIHSILLYIYSF